jgi:hypothetical protein
MKIVVLPHLFDWKLKLILVSLLIFHYGLYLSLMLGIVLNVLAYEQ